MFSSNRAGEYDIYQQAADGLGNAAVVIQSNDQAKYINDLTTDGRYAISRQRGASVGRRCGRCPFVRRPQTDSLCRRGAQCFQRTVLTERPLCGLQVKRDGKERDLHTDVSATNWKVANELRANPNGDARTSLSRDQKRGRRQDRIRLTSGIPKELFQAQSIPPWYWKNIYVPDILRLTPGLLLPAYSVSGLGRMMSRMMEFISTTAEMNWRRVRRVDPKVSNSAGVRPFSV